MKTEDLIEALTADGAPLPRRRSPALAPLLASTLACFALLALALGSPLYALPQIGTAPYLMKFGFAASVAVLGTWALLASGKPGGAKATSLLSLAVPFTMVLLLAAAEIVSTDPAWPGRTWVRCTTSIALLTPLGFIACVRILRSLAPTNLRLGGTLAGVVSSAVAASAYALWCPESTASFLASWYLGAILIAAICGAIVGPRFLRW